MESNEFLLSLKGLIARHASPTTIYSDNGSTFIGAAAWMREVTNEEKLNDLLAHGGAGQHSYEQNYRKRLPNL